MAKSTKTTATQQVAEQTQQIDTNQNDPGSKYTLDKLMEQHSNNKSSIIRALDAEGYKRGPIAKFMGIKYQFVRNVLITPVSKKS